MFMRATRASESRRDPVHGWFTARRLRRPWFTRLVHERETRTAMRVVAVIVLCGIVGGSINGADTTVTIDGKARRTSGNTVTVIKGAVIVDGKVLAGPFGDVVKGSGTVATETRDLGRFTELRQDISATVTVKAGATGRCTITADDNILPLIVTERAGNVLRITCTKGYVTSRRIQIDVETPLLTRAELAGSGEIEIVDVTKDRIALDISGSGDIRATGRAAELDATINGSGDVAAAGLIAGTVHVTVNGSGDAHVHARSALTTEIHGSGDIVYAGNPARVRHAVSGSGTVAKE